MRDYLVFGTRFNKFDEIFEWILDHTDAGYIGSSYKTHKEGKYDVSQYRFYKETENRFFVFDEHSLVYNEDLMLCRNTVNYQKSIIILRDIQDVIDDMLTITFKSVDKVVEQQVELFEEYVDELTDESHYIPDGYKFFIYYNRWCDDIEYRDYVASVLKFKNTDFNIRTNNPNKSLRNKVRYRKYITTHLQELNRKVISLL